MFLALSKSYPIASKQQTLRKKAYIVSHIIDGIKHELQKCNASRHTISGNVTDLPSTIVISRVTRELRKTRHGQHRRKKCPFRIIETQ